MVCLIEWFLKLNLTPMYINQSLVILIKVLIKYSDDIMCTWLYIGIAFNIYSIYCMRMHFPRRKPWTKYNKTGLQKLLFVICVLKVIVCLYQMAIILFGLYIFSLYVSLLCVNCSRRSFVAVAFLGKVFVIVQFLIFSIQSTSK